MKTWRTSTLAEIASFARDIVEPHEILSGATYVGLENIESGGRFLNVKNVVNGELASSKFVFTDRHLLYGKLRPYLAKIACPDFDGVCSTDILPILPGPNADRKYLAYFLRQPDMVELASSRSAGANLPRLSPKVLAEFEIPLPPLPEQQRIAAILDAADALREKRRQAIVKLDGLVQAVFVEIFGECLMNGTRIPLSELVDEFRYGTSNKSQDKGLPTLRIPNVVAGSIDLNNLKFVPVDSSEATRLLLREGDILFVRTNGNPDNVGRCADFNRAEIRSLGYDPDLFIYASYLIRARLRTDRIRPVFLREFMMTKEGRGELRGRCKTSAGQYNINTEGLGAIPIPVPALDLQERFQHLAGQLQIEKSKQLASLTQFNTLFLSLQQRAFRGEL